MAYFSSILHTNLITSLRVSISPLPRYLEQRCLKLRELSIGILTAGMSSRAVAREFYVFFSTISHLQHCFRECGSTSNTFYSRRPRVTSPGPPVGSSETSHPDSIWKCGFAQPNNICTKLSETISRKLIYMLIVLIRVLTWLQFGVVTNFSGQMLTFDGFWHAGEVCSSWMNPGCILLMAIWMHRDIVTRSWGPLSWHSSAAISSCFSMKMPGPMSQGSVHNSWKRNMSQFFHGLHTHQTCHPLSMFGMLWIYVYDSVFQFPPISSIFPQPKGVGHHSTGHNQQPDQLYVKEMCRAAWVKWRFSNP